MHQLVFDPELLRRYDKSGPRYTSYPTAAQFHSGFTEADYRAQAQGTNATKPARPLSLYFHIPFCDTVCFYCACNKIITKNRRRATTYLERLHREIALQAELFDRSRVVQQLHWGGGTPTFIAHDEMRELINVTRKHFRLRDDDKGEYGIEVDPREVRPDTLVLLRELGFNRLSIGVQDFDPAVQKAVNRIQSEAETFAVLTQARELGFRSINMDLIYGLPHQTTRSFERTLDKIISAAPNRLSVFNYAHLPEMFKSQRYISASDLPTPQEKLNILQLTIERLTRAGYLYIGMDHFARPDDELAVAQAKGTLYRNFQGYSTHAECDLIGFGMTSIGMVGDCYSQNQKTTEDYYTAVDAGRLPIMRGIVLDSDDKLRRAVITQLICHFVLDFSVIERAHDIDFAQYFSLELADLKIMQQDGLLDMDATSLQVRPAGKLLIRNICMVFDRYLRDKQQHRFSKVI